MVWIYVLWGALSAFILHRYLAYRAAVESVNNAPGMRMLLRGGNILSYLLPRHKYLNPGMGLMWHKKYESGLITPICPYVVLTASVQVFEEAGADVITSVAVFPAGANITIADPAVIKVCTPTYT